MPVDNISTNEWEEESCKLFLWYFLTWQSGFLLNPDNEFILLWQSFPHPRYSIHLLPCYWKSSAVFIQTFRWTLRQSQPNKKDKGFPYLLPSVGPKADPGVQAVSPQVTCSHPPGGMLPLLSARTAAYLSSRKASPHIGRTKLYCLVTEAYACEQLDQGCYLEADRPRFEPVTFSIVSERSSIKPHRPHVII